MPYTADQARREFPPRLRRAAVLQLARHFGISPGTVRKLMAAKTISPIHYPGHGRAYYDLENALRVITNDQ